MNPNEISKFNAEGRNPIRYSFRVTCGWLRDLASAPTPNDRWPCIRWDDRLLTDQLRFLDAQAEVGATYNLAWGLFIDRAWPAPFENVIDAARVEKLKRFVDAAHERGLKVLSGLGVYSWGFDEVIAKVPGASAGHPHAMCAFSDVAWEWQRRVLDFLMAPQWGLDGVSMQSADQGRCDCPKCRKLSPAAHHAKLLIRCAEHIRANRPDWTIGQASWGLRLDEPTEFEYIRQISEAVDYMIEVRERSAESGVRAELVKKLACAFGSVGGVFIEPPQHWERLRWFVPCGLASTSALARLWADGGRACEYFYRPFANPVEEVSWRAGARILSAPLTPPESALGEAIEAVYGATGDARAALVDWFIRGEAAYFPRSSFVVGNGPLSLEPLVWRENPAAAGPPIYLRDRMSAAAREDYRKELEQLKVELARMDIPNQEAVDKTLKAIDGTLNDIRQLA
jgi:hypothetical protein